MKRGKKKEVSGDETKLRAHGMRIGVKGALAMEIEGKMGAQPPSWGHLVVILSKMTPLQGNPLA